MKCYIFWLHETNDLEGTFQPVYKSFNQCDQLIDRADDQCKVPWEWEFVDFFGAIRPYESVQIEIEKRNRREKKASKLFSLGYYYKLQLRETKTLIQIRCVTGAHKHAAQATDCCV